MLLSEAWANTQVRPTAPEWDGFAPTRTIDGRDNPLWLSFLNLYILTMANFCNILMPLPYKAGSMPNYISLNYK